MQVTVEPQGAHSARVSFTATPDEFRSHFHEQLARYGSRVRLKGFRPGHVPPALLERQFGEQARSESKQHLVQRALEQAVREHKLKIAMLPRLKLEDLAQSEGGGLAHAFEVFLKPTVELGAYRGMEVETHAVVVQDDEIESALANLRRQQSRPERASDEPLAADGVALGKVRLLHEGAEVLARDGFRLVPKNPPPGLDAAAFESALVGAREGETRELGLTFPADFEKPELRGLLGRAQFTVVEVYRVLAPSDEELFKLVQVADLPALRERASAEIRRFKELQENARLEGLLFAKLLETHAFEIAPGLVEAETGARLEGAAREALARGGADGDVEGDVARRKPEALKETERSLRAMYLIEAIGEKEALKVAEEELVGELRVIAARNHAKLEEVRDYYVKNGLVNQLALELLERKVRGFLRQHAKLSSVPAPA